MATAKGARSKDAIAAAAAELFSTGGYSNTTVRAIAAVAGVDPALVIRHFGSKEKLCVETRDTAGGQALDLDGPIESLGERLVQSLLTADAGARNTFLALVRASDTGNVGSAMRISHERGFVAPLLAHLTGPNREVRARLVAAMI